MALRSMLRKPWKPLMFSLEEYAKRIERTRESMRAVGVDLLVLTEPEDIFYLTAHQTVGAPQVQALMVPVSPEEELYFMTRLLELTNTEERSVLRQYFAYKDFEVGIDKVVELIKQRSPNAKHLGLQLASKRISSAQMDSLRAQLLKPGVASTDCSQLVGKLRLIKSEAEIYCIRRASDCCAAGVRAAQNAREGMTETQIAGKINDAMMNLGCEYPAYPPFVCAGRSACLGHYTGDGQTVLKEGETLFVEIGGCYARYHAALMRTIYVGHELPADLAAAGKAVAAAVDLAKAKMVPGARAKDVDAATRAILTKDGWVNSLRTGYSIGVGFYTDWGEAELLAIDPGSELLLEENMVLHLIPWIQLPAAGQAVGLSDTVRVTKTGAVSVFDPEPPREIALIKPTPKTKTSPFGVATAKRARAFFKPHQPVLPPLVELRELAGELGVRAVLCKDESARFGTMAFKAQGAALAMAEHVCDELGVQLSEIRGGLAELGELWQWRRPGETITFVTCTDGNHGQAVAWAARILGQRAVVYMPKNTAEARVKRVTEQGAECTKTALNYDDAVSFAAKQAKENAGWVLLQDTTVPDVSNKVCTTIMQGYTQMVDEALEQAAYPPTHVVLQVGVGSMAAAVLAYLVERSAAEASRPMPKIITLEPEKAACAFASAQAGAMTAVGGDHDTMIQGLACGVPSDIAWPILTEHVDGYSWIADDLAGNGMRRLAREGVVAGECGGAAVGLLERLLDPECKQAAAAKQALGLGQDSVVLIFNTEGATDPVNYDKQLAAPMVPPGSCAFGFHAAERSASPRAKKMRVA